MVWTRSLKITPKLSTRKASKREASTKSKSFGTQAWTGKWEGTHTGMIVDTFDVGGLFTNDSGEHKDRVRVEDEKVTSATGGNISADSGSAS